MLFFSYNMGKRITHGISFPDPELLALAKERAKRLDMSLSKYINKLIKNDLAERSALIFSEDEGSYSRNSVAGEVPAQPERKAAQ